MQKGSLLTSCLLRVGLLGFEPRRTESKSVVLPLHYNPIVAPNCFGTANVGDGVKTAKMNL